MKRLLFVAAVLALAPLSTALADDGLYEDVFDPASSFVRVLAPGQTVASINGKSLHDLEGGVSGFVNVMPGDIDIVLPNGNVAMNVSASKHYTVILTDDGQTTIIDDDITNSPAKADVSLYNLSSAQTVDLLVPAANAVAIAGTDHFASQTVSVRAPLTLDFEVREGEESLAQLSQVNLVRGGGVTIVLVDADDGFSAFSTANSYVK